MPATVCRMPMTHAIARAVATDAGNRSMRAGGRRAWSEADYNAAVEVFNYHWPQERELERFEEIRTVRRP